MIVFTYQALDKILDVVVYPQSVLAVSQKDNRTIIHINHGHGQQVVDQPFDEVLKQIGLPYVMFNDEYDLKMALYSSKFTYGRSIMDGDLDTDLVDVVFQNGFAPKAVRGSIKDIREALENIMAVEKAQ